MTALTTLPQEIATVVLVAILAFSLTWALASWLIDDAEPDPFDAAVDEALAVANASSDFDRWEAEVSA